MTSRCLATLSEDRFGAVERRVAEALPGTGRTAGASQDSANEAGDHSRS